MESNNNKYIIGIDLGTTNCTMAYSHVEGNDPVEQFAIPQIISAGCEGENSLLPSYIYYPLAEEIQSKQIGISWDSDRT